MSLLATVELLVDPVESEALPLLARPLVLSLCEDEVLAVLDGEALLLIEPELWAAVSLLATVELLVEPVEPEALPLLAKPLVLPVGDDEASEAEDEDVLAVPLVLSLLATLALVEGEVELLLVEGEALLNEPEAEPDAAPLTLALMFVFEF